MVRNFVGNQEVHDLINLNLFKEIHPLRSMGFCMEFWEDK